MMGNPQMPATTSGNHHHHHHTQKSNSKIPKPDLVGTSSRRESKDIEFALPYKDIPDWDELKDHAHFRIGIVVQSHLVKDRYVSAMSKPASSCTLTSLVVLDDEDGNGNYASPNKIKKNNKNNEKIDYWMKTHRLDFVENNEKTNIRIGWGQQGFQDLLKSPDVDAVYVIVPPGTQREYVLSALQAQKHVLLNDPISTSLVEFTEQQQYAKRYGKFIQFTTMFLHQHKVRSFIEGVLYNEDFGRRIRTINSFVRLSFDDVEKVGVKFPLTAKDGAITVLGRFCVLMTTLFFSRVGSYAQSAQVKYIKDGASGETLSAECVVTYSEVR